MQTVICTIYIVICKLPPIRLWTWKFDRIKILIHDRGRCIVSFVLLCAEDFLSAYFLCLSSPGELMSFLREFCSLLEPFLILFTIAGLHLKLPLNFEVDPQLFSPIHWATMSSATFWSG